MREPYLKVIQGENLGDEQHFLLCDILRYNLKTVRAYLLKEALQQPWDYNSPRLGGQVPRSRAKLTLTVPSTSAASYFAALAGVVVYPGLTQG